MEEAQRQLDGFLAKFTPEVDSLAHDLAARMRVRLPGATIMVYDNYNALAIGFGPTEKPSQAVLSLAVFPRRPPRSGGPPARRGQPGPARPAARP
jgi:hypothetical protein